MWQVLAERERMERKLAREREMKIEQMGAAG